MRKYGNGRFKKGIETLVLMLLVSLSTIVLYDMYIKIDVVSNNGTNENGVNIVRTAGTVNNSNEESIENIISKVSKCVVGISKLKDNGNSVFLNNSAEQLGLGSGVIISENGYILTNWHVSGNKYSTCYVTLENGTEHSAKVIWADTDIDLAIIKINNTGLDYANLGDSDYIKVAQNVYAIGNPIGFEFSRTVTAGIISAVDRTIILQEDDKSSYMEDLIQTDATINPGNSGGPLINTNGEVIGINSVKITSAEGIGFAIPINIVKPIIDKAIKGDDFNEAYLGIFAYDKQIIPYLDINLKLDHGIYVAQIALDGPSVNSNLKIGDIITKIDNVTLDKMSDLREYIYTKNPGDEVSLTVLRNNRETIIKLKLGKR